MDFQYQIVTIGDGFYSIEENGVRSFLICGADKAMLIDTGFGSGDLKSVASRLTQLPVVLVNSHADGDHIGCNAQFEAAYMHPSEYDRFAGKGGKQKLLPLFEGDTIDLGGIVFDVIHIPGHTPGSIALLDKQQRILFAGDSIQAGGIYMFGPGRHMQAYIYSMQRLDGMTHLFDKIYASHGELWVPPSVVKTLTEDAQSVLDGKVPPQEPPNGQPCKLYCASYGKFLYEAL